MDYTSESGTVSIPTLFMWRHGGSIVHISGSFTGWAQCPMTPIEGCPTVFQTICSVLPGRHQYKFVVDGTWRHDEDQPSVISTMGIVNTIHLPRDADHLSPMPSLQAPPSGHGSSMDVDNETFQCVVRLSGVMYPKPFVTISEADLEISRHRIAVFMSAHKAYELLPESGKVIALDVELPVKQAFHVLHEQGISMAPLWDISRGNFVGVLSAMDFILIMRELRRHGSKLTEEELETHTISAWKEAKPYLNNQINGQGAVVSRQLVQAGPDDSLNDVALKILQNGVATVPIIHSSSADSLNKNLLHLASLSGILKCICRFFRHSLSSLPVLQLPICSIPLGTWVPIIGESNRRPLAMLRSSASLSAALNLFIQAQVSSIPIVDDNDSLLDVYSRSDITSLARNKIYTRINLDETTIFEALQYRDDPFLANGSNIQRCFMCLRSDPLHKVLERLAQPGVRRLVVVEAGSKHVEGIVSLNDVFRFIMGC